MTATEQFVPVEIPRDGYGRPYVIPPSGGTPVPYTRCTTFVGSIEDTYILGQWQQRHVAIGLAMDPELLDLVRSSDLADKQGLNTLVDKAKDVAGASDSARIGTYLHALTEAIDRQEDTRGVPMPTLAVQRQPADFEADLAAYVRATEGMRFTHVEEFGVLDALRIGGTADRIVEVGGHRYIADLKTGSIRYGSLKIAAQLAVYARSHLYDWRSAAALGKTATREQAKALRTAPGVDVDRGIVIHLPQGEGTCTLYWTDLLAGWDAVRVCRDIRERRTVKHRDVFSPYVEPMALNLASLITATTDADELRALWRDNESSWTDELTVLAQQHLAAL